MNVTVHVGDSLQLLASMPAACVDAVITDPPYGISFQSQAAEGGPRFDLIYGDGEPQIAFLPDAVRMLRDGGALFVFCEWRHQETFRAAIAATGVTIRNQCIWDREARGMGDLVRQFSPGHDCCWFATKGDAFVFHGPRPGTVLRFPRVSWQEQVHPAEKPVALLRFLVRRLVPPGGIVLDPFAGSGSLGVAAVMEGRRAVLCEMVPEYADIAVRRCAAAETVADWRVPRQGGLFAHLAAEGA